MEPTCFGKYSHSAFPGNFCGFCLQLQMEEFFASLPFHTNSRLQVEVNKELQSLTAIYAFSDRSNLQCANDKFWSIFVAGRGKVFGII